MTLWSYNLPLTPIKCSYLQWSNQVSSSQLSSQRVIYHRKQRHRVLWSPNWSNSVRTLPTENTCRSRWSYRPSSHLCLVVHPSNNGIITYQWQSIGHLEGWASRQTKLPRIVFQMQFLYPWTSQPVQGWIARNQRQIRHSSRHRPFKAFQSHTIFTWDEYGLYHGSLRNSL